MTICSSSTTHLSNLLCCDDLSLFHYYNLSTNNLKTLDSSFCCYSLVMLLLADVDERPAFSTPWPRWGPTLAGGEMSTTMPTALLGSEGRDRGGGELDR